jgi:uncharacterized protein (DUF1501 family)
MDGLMAVTPFTDQFLKAARPTIFMEAGAGKPLIDLDGRFGLHPAMKNFEPLFREKNWLLYMVLEVPTILVAILMHKILWKVVHLLKKVQVVVG